VRTAFLRSMAVRGTESLVLSMAMSSNEKAGKAHTDSLWINHIYSTI
jgi:hypothetical protein